MLLCGELLEQIMIGCVGGMQTLGQPVAEPMLMGKKQPNVSTSVLGNTCGEKKRRKTLLRIQDTYVGKQANVHMHPRTHTIHLGRVHDLTLSCPAERLFCPGLLVFSPTAPEHLWSTGPLLHSSVSSCVCAVHLGSLPDNQSRNAST